jgi:hypothetical protein
MGEADRACLAVLAEVWGERAALMPRILACRVGGGGPATVRLLPDGDRPAAGEDGRVAVPWIACERCGALVARLHREEPWGGLCPVPERYPLLGPGGGRIASHGTAVRAFDALSATCPAPAPTASATPVPAG